VQANSRNSTESLEEAATDDIRIRTDSGALISVRVEQQQGENSNNKKF
jgi:hypothetical protein